MWDFLPPDAFYDRTWSDMPAPGTSVETDVVCVCDGCNQEMAGYQMGELMVHHGWRLHSIGVGRPMFALCGDCQTKYFPGAP